MIQKINQLHYGSLTTHLSVTSIQGQQLQIISWDKLNKISIIIVLIQVTYMYNGLFLRFVNFLENLSK